MVHCAGCQSPILDRYLFNVLDRPWHGRCLQCNECQINLSEKCFFKEGKLFCRTDFFKRYGTKCSGCGLGISPTDLVRRARSKVFHLKCLICMICRKQLCTGEELYILDDSQFVCKDDYLNLKPTKNHYPLNPSSVNPKETSDSSVYKRCSATCNEDININLHIPEAYGGTDKTYCPYSLPTVQDIRPPLLEPSPLNSHNFSIPALGQQNEDVFNGLARRPKAPRARRPRGSCSSSGAFSFLSPPSVVPSSPGRKLSTSTRGNSPLTTPDQATSAKRTGNKKKSPCKTNNSLLHTHNFNEASGVAFNMAAEMGTLKPEDDRGPSSCGTEGGAVGCEEGEEDLSSLYYYEDGGGDEGDEDIEEECDIEEEDGEDDGADEIAVEDCCDEDDGGSSRSFVPPTILSSGSPSCGQMAMDPAAFYKGMMIASVGDASNEMLPGSGCYGRPGVSCGGPGSVVSNGNNGNNSNNNKRRGPRTTIKAKQLETLKSAFAATPKPTRHIREQLARETGLNMRVIQVWFQNRRSKERRMKQLSALGARRHFFRHSRRIRTVIRPEFSPLREGEDNSNKVNNLPPQLSNQNNGNAINNEACNYSNEFHNFFPSSDANNFNRPFGALDHNGAVSPSMMLSHMNAPKDMSNGDAQRLADHLDRNYLDQLTSVHKNFYPFDDQTPAQSFKGQQLNNNNVGTATADGNNNNQYGHYQQLDRLQNICPPSLSLMIGTREPNNATNFECEINDMKSLQRDPSRFETKQLFPYLSQDPSNFNQSTQSLCLLTNFSQPQQFRGQQDTMRKGSLSEELMTNNDFTNDTNEIITM